MEERPKCSVCRKPPVIYGLCIDHLTSENLGEKMCSIQTCHRPAVDDESDMCPVHTSMYALRNPYAE